MENQQPVDTDNEDMNLMQRDKLIQSVNNLENPLEGILLKSDEIANNTSTALDVQVELQSETNERLDRLIEELSKKPSVVEVKGEDINIDMKNIENSIEKIVNKVNEPITIKLSLV
jgi:uncharacterized membrane protein YhiD involved in acid resistance